MKNGNSSDERYSAFFYSLLFEKNSFPFFTPRRRVRRLVFGGFRTKHRSGFLRLAVRKPTEPDQRRTETGWRRNCDGKLAGDARLADQIPAAPGPNTGWVFFVSPRGSQQDRTQGERRPDDSGIAMESSPETRGLPAEFRRLQVQSPVRFSSSHREEANGTKPKANGGRTVKELLGFVP